MPSRCAVLILVAIAALPVRAADPELTTDHHWTLYALGVKLAQNLEVYHLKEDEIEFVKAGLTDAVFKRAKADPASYVGPITFLAAQRVRETGDAEEKLGKPFRDKARTQPGAKETDSGLIYTEIKPGTGESPTINDKVKIHYHGTLVDGTVFDSTLERGKPNTFGLGKVIQCWSEGIQLMKVGGKSTFVCPSDLAFGYKGGGKLVKPGATVMYEVELVEIVK